MMPFPRQINAPHADRRHDGREWATVWFRWVAPRWRRLAAVAAKRGFRARGHRRARYGCRFVSAKAPNRPVCSLKLTAPSNALPLDDTSFGVVVIDDQAGDFAAKSPNRLPTFAKPSRVLQPGGRVLAIGGTRRRAFLPPWPPRRRDCSTTPLEASGCPRRPPPLVNVKAMRFVEASGHSRNTVTP